MPLYRHHPFTRKANPPAFWLVYVLSSIFMFQGMLVAYSNSTYMEQFVSTEVIGTLYTIGSALCVFAFLFISRVLQKLGNTKMTLSIATLQLITLLVMGFAFSPATTIVAFVIFLVVNPLLFLTIDIFSENLIGNNESSTGSKRGLALALMSITALAGPIALSLIVGDNDSNLYRTYFVSAGIFSLFILLVIIHFRTFKDPPYKEVKVLKAIHNFWEVPDVRNVFLAHFFLQVFFSWMVIYLPLYLATTIGLTWDSIGFIIAAGMFAYLVFEYPIGLLADRYWGEKEMMAIGFLILAVSTAAISFMAGASVVAWMILMFISRTGASLVEATTESYFFKHTKGGDANTISFFRLTRPLSTVLGALLGSAALLYLPFELIFVVLGFCMVPGIYFTNNLHDTK